MKSNKNFKNFNKKFEQRPTIKNFVRDICNLEDGDYLDAVVKILHKSQPGPVVFVISDGSKAIEAVTKESNFQAGDTVRVIGRAMQRAEKLQIEIDSMQKTNENISNVIDKNSAPVKRPFSIHSSRYSLMENTFHTIAKRIRKAILENQSILIRYHGDADGIISGLVLERACKNVMIRTGINPDYNLYLSPSRAPFYEISDVFRDAILTKRIIEGHGQKKPLVIVLDNGSTPEDVLGLKTIKSLGFEAIVVDHHNPVVVENKKSLVDPFISLHLNPYLFGLDSKTCAGMLAYELARFVDEKYDDPILPAVAGISDRCDIPETEEYIKNSGKTRAELEKMGIAIDFISYNIKFDAGRGLIDQVFINDIFCKTINEEVKKGVETQLQSTLPYLRSQEIEGIYFSSIDIEKYTVRFKYPAPGKVVGMIHDIVSAEKEAPHITIGCLSDMFIIRANKPVLPIETIIKKLKKDLPHANVDGGGHECAGTIKFVSAHSEEILNNIKKQIKDLKYLESSQN